MPALLEDHGLPVVQLKERRRDLIVPLMGRHGPLLEHQISEIASIQSAITAFEAVLDDLDAEAVAVTISSHAHAGFWHRCIHHRSNAGRVENDVVVLSPAFGLGTLSPENSKGEVDQWLVG